MSKRTKQKAHKKAVAQSHVEQIRKLKAQLQGRQDIRAQYQAAAKASVKFVEDRQPALTKLGEEGAVIGGLLRDLTDRMVTFDKLLTAAIEVFDDPLPQDEDSVAALIAERDEALSQVEGLRDQLAEQGAELSKMRLERLDRTTPTPPNWLLRAEREFDKTARILTGDLKNRVAQKALNWARDYRLLNKSPKDQGSDPLE